MTKLLANCIATFLSCGLLLAPATSWACGGCFGPQTAITTVTGHRMAFAVSAERTVLWDQFEYSGSPEDFSWVLPVRPGAFLEASSDAWFEALELVTQTRTFAPQLNCAFASSDNGCGCGMMSSDGAQADLAKGGTVNDPGVQVIHRGTVGPYETVTLRSTDQNALTTWLIQNGYFIPPDIEPVIAAYVAEGADFVALKLRPGQGVQQMTPVRVVTPGGEFLLPLRMVAAGVGQSVGIVLYVIGEQRFTMPDLRQTFIDSEDLVWDFNAGSSNYADLRLRALRELDGANYLMTFAFQGAFSRTFERQGFPLSFQAGTRSVNNFADAYFAQAASNTPASAQNCSSIQPQLASDELVQAEGSGLSAASFSCGTSDDIGAAMIGMHPAQVWMTRLELELPKEALSMDCILVPDGSEEEVSQLIEVTRTSNRPPGCDEAIFESRIAKAPPRRASAWLALLGAALGLGLRRRWRTR